MLEHQSAFLGSKTLPIFEYPLLVLLLHLGAFGDYLGTDLNTDSSMGGNEVRLQLNVCADSRVNPQYVIPLCYADRYHNSLQHTVSGI